METLVTKMRKMGLLRFVLIYYAVIYIALALVLPVTIVDWIFYLYSSVFYLS